MAFAKRVFQLSKVRLTSVCFLILAVMCVTGILILNSMRFKTKIHPDLMKIVLRSISTKSRFNALATDNFRSVLQRECNTSGLFTMTKLNADEGKTIQYSLRDETFKVTPEMYTRFPNTALFSTGQFDKCSLVGNSGILRGSRCGASIDNADFIMRMNLPNISSYTEDVGTKTNFMSCNPSVLSERFSSLDAKGTELFQTTLSKEFRDTIVCFDAFSTADAVPICFKAQDDMKSFNATAVFLHPTYRVKVNNYWKSIGMKSFLSSSGIVYITAAFSICRELHLYGFWPFSEDLSGQPLPYHYYGRKITPSSYHNMPSEFALFLDLHKKGILHLHINACKKK